MFFLRVAFLFLLGFTALPAAGLEANINCHTPACLQLQNLQPETNYSDPPSSPIQGCQKIQWQQPTFQGTNTTHLGCYRQETPIDLNLKPRYQPMVQETRNFFFMSWGMMLAIYALPEDVSNWDRSEMSPDKLPGNWRENMKEAPVWDKDDWQLNYINHPYIGTMYYMVARNQGLTPLESFSYSFWMSALLWEFGVESTAEPGSIQDTLVTPIIGSILGEAFYIWEQRILNNEGKVLGSTALGSTTLIFLNPAGTLSGLINKAVDSQDFIKESRATWVVQSASHPLQQEQAGYVEPAWIGMQLELLF